MSEAVSMEHAHPAVKRTYGRPKPAAPGLAESSSSSDLTNLSQLSYSKSDGDDVKTSSKPLFNPSSSDAEDEDGNDSGYTVVRQSLNAALKQVDEGFDNTVDEEIPNLFSSPVQRAQVPAADEKQQDRPRSPSSSSPNLRRQSHQLRSSTPATEEAQKERTTSPTSAEDAASDEEDQVRRRTKKAKKLSIAHKKVLDSDESDGSHRVKRDSGVVLSDGDDDEDALPLMADAARLPSKAFKGIKDSSNSEEETAGISQKTEDIEQYQDSQEDDEGKDSKGRSRTGRAPRAASKKDVEDAHALHAAQLRKRDAYIASGSRPPKPLSEILKKIRTADGPVSSATKSSGSNRSRSASSKPTLQTRPVHSGMSAKPRFSSSTANKPIEIGSSSVIFDADQVFEDSYDPSYLQSIKETQDQTQFQQKDLKPILKKSATPALAKKEEEDEDEELPDVAVEMEKQRKARALASRKAEALLRQQVKQDRKEEKQKPETQTYVDYKGKGKARAKTTTMMDLDSEDSELEIVLPKTAPLAIEKKPHHPHTQRFMKTMLPASVKLEVKHEPVTDSQFERAGRTFGQGNKKTVVAAHVAMKASRNKPTAKASNTVSKKDLDNMLTVKINRQAVVAKTRRVEDWKKRGGTLRTDYEGEKTGLIQQISVQSLEDEEEGGDSRTKNLMDQMREDAEHTGNVGEEEEGDDDEDDEDYLGSGDEKGSGEENEMMDLDAGSGSEADEEDEDEEEKELSKSRAAELQAASPGMELTQAASPSRAAPTSETEEESEAVFRRPMKARQIIADDEDSTSSPNVAFKAADAPNHDFLVQTQAAFPQFDNAKMGEISLTQAFGNPEDSQSAPMPSKIANDDGFGDLFDDTLGFDDSQVAVTPSQVVPKELPKMFQNNVDTPVIRRHQLGEAPMILDAALRDAEMREDVEKAYYEMQQRKAQAEAAKQIKDLTTTPGSTTSEEYEPLPIVTELIQRMDDRLPEEEEEEEEEADSVTQARLRSIARSEASTELFEESQDSPSVPRRRLIRAGENAEEGSSSPEAPRVLTAFDVLKQGAKKQMTLKDRDDKAKRKMMKKNEFVAEQADESEEEGMYSTMRKAADEEGDNEDESDLDGSVEDLVDDEKVDGVIQEEQDELAHQRYQQDMEAEDAKNLKVAQKVVAGDMKKRKKGMELDDSDYEDDDMMFRKAKARKPAEFSGIVEAISANPTTAAFGDALKDHVTLSQDENTQYLALEIANGDGQPTSEMDHEQEYESEGYESDTKHRKGRSGRTPSPDIIDIDRMIWARSSPATVEKPRIKDNVAAIFQKPAMAQKAIVHDDFGDLDIAYSYKESQTLSRRVIQFDKEESQNDRGVGPGKSSAVTSFVKKGTATARVSTSTTTVTSQKLMVAANKSLARSNSTISAGGKGRLAQARLSKK